MTIPPMNGPRPEGRGAPGRGPVARGPSGAPGTTRPGAGSTQERIPTRRSWLTFLLILLVNYALVRMLFPRGEQAVTVPYTLFKQQVTGRNVEKIYSRGESIRGRFRRPVTYPPPADTATGRTTGTTTRAARGADSASRVQPRSVRTFETTLPSFFDPGFETLLISNGVDVSAEPIDEGGSP